MEIYRLLDCHTHPYELKLQGETLDPDGIFHRENPANAEDLLRAMDEASVERSVVLGLDLETTRNFKFSNDQVAEIINKYPERFIGFCSVDPHKGILAPKELERSIKFLKLSGLKLHPILQEFYPNDRKVYEIYELAQELKIPILFDSGQTFLRGYIKYGNPIFIDDLAVDFPRLKIIIAHFGWPWMEEAISMAWTHRNVYIDLAGWSPRYLPETLLKHINSVLASKTLFGTDYPFITPSKWVSEFKLLKLISHTKK